MIFYNSISLILKLKQTIKPLRILFNNKSIKKMKMRITLDDLSVLKESNVYMKNQDGVFQKINNIVDDGIDSLQIVSDYDLTLTKQHENGKAHVTSFGMMHLCRSVPDWYLQEEQKLYKKYRSIEIDPHISYEEKFKHMVDWWTASEKLLTGLKMSRDEFEEVAEKCNPALRDGTKEMMEDLYSVNVPVLVFSAGLGDAVVAVLKQNNVLYPNVKVISNYLGFDKNNVVTGYRDKMITVLNKNEQVLKGTEYYDLVQNRGNVILMGDHVGDAGMAEGVPHQKSVLKIGFLYERVEECLPEYMDAFDIVLVDDQTMNVTRLILNLLLQNKK